MILNDKVGKPEYAIFLAGQENSINAANIFGNHLNVIYFLFFYFFFQVVGLLLRARKYNLVYFEGETLFQAYEHKKLKNLIEIENKRKFYLFGIILTKCKYICSFVNIN